MPTSTDFEPLNCMIAEATAHCEAAHQRLEEIRDELLKSIEHSRSMCGVAEEEQARRRSFDAQAWLSNLRRIRGDRPPH